MDSNQTIQLRPVYSHSQLNSIYNGPVLSATMFTPSGLSIVGSATNNDGTNAQTSSLINKSSDDNNPELSTLTSAMIPGCITTGDNTQFVPVNNVCLNNFQIHPIQMQKTAFSTNQSLQAANQLNSNGQLQLHQHYQFQQQQHIQQQSPACGQLFQIISAPGVHNNGIVNTTESIDIQRANLMTNGQTLEKSSLVSDSSSSISNGSTSSTISESTNLTSDLVNKMTTGSMVNSRNVKICTPSASSSSSASSLSIIDHQSNGPNIKSNVMLDNQMSSDGISMKIDLVGINNNNSNNDTSSINATFTTFTSASSTPSTSNNGSINDNGCVNIKRFKCDVCLRNFTQKGNLKTHLMTHSGERPYECPVCKKNFTQKGNLDTHIKIHTETKDHKCQYCDRGFTQRGNLKTHVRSIHTKEKPHSCGHCGKSFSQRGNMLTHFKTHDKETRFPCTTCGKTFSQKGNLKTHQQRHGRETTK